MLAGLIGKFIKCQKMFQECKILKCSDSSHAAKEGVTFTGAYRPTAHIKLFILSSRKSSPRVPPVDLLFVYLVGLPSSNPSAGRKAKDHPLNKV